MFNLNSGYSGFSMSKRAVEAYSNGEQPYSKWSKQEIIGVISDAVSKGHLNIKFDLEVLKKLTASEIREVTLYCSS